MSTALTMQACRKLRSARRHCRGSWRQYRGVRFSSVLLSNKASLVSRLQLPTVRSSKTRCRVGSSKMIGGSRKANEDTIGEKAKPAVGLPVSLGRPKPTSSVGRVPWFPFFRDGARCLGEEYFSKRLVEFEDRHVKCTSHYCSSSSRWKEWVEEVERDSWIERFGQDPKEILRVKAVKTGQWWGEQWQSHTCFCGYGIRSWGATTRCQRNLRWGRRWRPISCSREVAWEEKSGGSSLVSTSTRRSCRSRSYRKWRRRRKSSEKRTDMRAEPVKGMYPAPHIHEHFAMHKWLRQTAYILTHNLNMLEHIANNGMNTTTHTDANIAQFWARRAPSVDAHVFTHRTCGSSLALCVIPYHPCMRTCVLLLEWSLLTRLSASSSSSSSSSTWCQSWRLMRSPWKIPCATPGWGAWSLWTMSHPSQVMSPRTWTSQTPMSWTSRPPAISTSRTPWTIPLPSPTFLTSTTMSLQNSLQLWSIQQGNLLRWEAMMINFPVTSETWKVLRVSFL